MALVICAALSVWMLPTGLSEAREREMQGSSAPAPETAAEIAVAVRQLRADDEVERDAGAEALSKAAAEGRLEAIVALVPVVTDSNDGVRHHAFHGLARAGESAVQPLLDAYRASDDEEFRFQVAAIMGQIGPAARPAIPELRSALNEPDSKLAPRAAGSLGKIGAHEAIPDLIDLYAATRRTGTLGQVSLAFRNLGTDQAMRRSKERLVARLVEELDSPDPSVRGSAVKFADTLYRQTESDGSYDFPTLEQLRPLIPGLVRAVGDTEAEAQLQAIRAIERAGADAAEAAYALGRQLDRDDLRASAMKALAALDTAESLALRDERLELEALEKRVRIEFSIADHQGRVSLLPFWVTGSIEDGVQLSARFTYRGRTPRRPEYVVLLFESYAPQVRLEGVSEIPWQVAAGPGAVRKIETREIERARASWKRGEIEKLSGVVTLDEFLAIAYAERASARLGPLELVIPEAQLAALRHLAGKIPAQ